MFTLQLSALSAHTVYDLLTTAQSLMKDKNRLNEDVSIHKSVQLGQLTASLPSFSSLSRS